MMSAMWWPAVFLLLSAHLCLCEYSIDDATLFKINFDRALDQEAKEQMEKATAESTPSTSPRSVIMTSSNLEKYECTLPVLLESEGAKEETYSGPIALEILEQLFNTQQCAYRLEHFWTYELCHGRYIRQFHEERDGKSVKLTEYYLGKYDADTLAKDIEHTKKLMAEAAADSGEEGGGGGHARKPQKKKIDTLTLPYYELTMTDGTVCDLNGQPRITHVNYVCYPAGKHEMYSFKESSTCEYDVVVLSPTLCNHPDYRPEESSENLVNCRPLDEKSPYKPRNLVQIEAESLKLRTENKMFEGEFMQGDGGPGSVKIHIRQVGGSGGGSAEATAGAPGDVVTDEDLEDERESVNWPTRPSKQREPFKPLMDPEVVKEFLMGDYCLYGGSGWWKYEFCYGKSVVQYHQEGKERKTVINLGAFDKTMHLNWLKANPNKRPKPVDARKHVSHFYSNGDVCDVTKRPRQVEVKLKCKRSDSPSTVSLYLLEPKTCEYVLGVESPLVCDIIHLADQDGIMDITKEDFDESATPRPQPPPITPDEGESPAVEVLRQQKAAKTEDIPTAEQSTLKRAPPLKRKKGGNAEKEKVFDDWDEDEDEDDEDED